MTRVQTDPVVTCFGHVLYEMAVGMPLASKTIPDTVSCAQTVAKVMTVSTGRPKTIMRVYRCWRAFSEKQEVLPRCL